MEEIEFKIIESSWERNDRAIIATSELDALIMIDYPKDEKDIGFIWNFWVKKERRHHGLGRKLMGVALEHIKSRGCRIAMLEWNSADTPVWVLAWYQRLGFEEESFGNKYIRLVKKL